MKNRINKYITVLILGFFIVISCVEEIDFVQPNDIFESALVVEATITNELKQQKIVLSRTYEVEADGPNPESNAQIQVLSGSEIIPFTETEPGIYLSEFEFSAQPNIDYQLLITTNDGKEYSSTKEQLTQVTQIDSLYAERVTNDFGENGMAIYVDSFDPTGNSKYYRYTYEETYKIIAPNWVAEDLIVLNNDWPYCNVILVEKTEEKRVCYKTVRNSSVINNNISLNSESVISRFPVRFINSDNYILTWRYSILVNQFVQSERAYNFFEFLKNSSLEGNLFSQMQQGYFVGNINSNTNEKVIGFFEVSTVDTKRLFFSFNDFYANEPEPDFPSACTEVLPKLYVVTPDHLSGVCGSLIHGLLENEIVFSRVNDSLNASSSLPYFTVPRACGDCTALGSNIVPDFWED